jgi:hypothetical protein
MSSSMSIPMLTATSNNFLEYESKLRTVLLSKGLWHICDPDTKVLTRPTIKIEKGAAQVEGFVAPTPAEHADLLVRAEIVQNHEVVLLMSNSLDFSLHHLQDPHHVPEDTQLGRAVYLNIDRHFNFLKEDYPAIRPEADDPITTAIQTGSPTQKAFH